MRRPVVAERRSLQQGFTLVELLVVIAIIGILVALLLPAVQAAREAARRSQCQNNVKQMTLATLNFENAKGVLPVLYTFLNPHTKNSTPAHGVHIWILPYMEYQPVYDQYDFKALWSAFANNEKAAGTDIPEFICPSAPPINDRSRELPNGRDKNVRAYTDYAINGRIVPTTVCFFYKAGLLKDRPDWAHLFTGVPEYDDFDTGGCTPGEPAGALKKQTGISKLKQATDGLSHTIMWSPDAGRPDWYEDGKLHQPPATNVSGSRWASPDTEYWTHNICAGGHSMINCHNDNETYSFHIGGGYFSFADGSVHFIADDIDIEVQVSLHTRAGEDTTAAID
jgi:prepilin-type N-terminal cleavage/methylation domain-containing protein